MVFRCCDTSLAGPFRLSSQPSGADARPAPVPNRDAHAFAPVRSKLWELPEHMHCSVIGTCLTGEDLRRCMAEAGLIRKADTEHDLHGRAVGLAGHNSPGAKLLQRALDAAHDLAVKQFRRAKSADAVQRLWAAALERGDIPGPYWALLTHPNCDYGLRRDAFGRVHMLSHLVGAANRADIKQLADLAAVNAGLAAKVQRQQERLQVDITARDRTIQALQDELARRDLAPARTDAPREPAPPLLHAGSHRRLQAAERRSASLEAKLAQRTKALDQERAGRLAAQEDGARTAAELAATEAALARGNAAGDMPAAVAGRVLLYVGGHPHQVAALRTLTGRLGGAFTYHDGGVEAQISLLSGLVSRADLVLFPVDCVSHEAALAVKRLCRASGKLFLPLRSAGQGAFLAALQAASDHLGVAA